MWAFRVGGRGDDTGVGVKEPTTALTLRAHTLLLPGCSREAAAVPISSPYFLRPLPVDQLTRVSSPPPAASGHGGQGLGVVGGTHVKEGVPRQKVSFFGVKIQQLEVTVRAA